MKIFVEVACELDPELNLRVDRATGEAIAEEGDQICRVCPAGSLAVDVAVELGDSLPPGAAEVIAFAVGRGHREALAAALARGARAAVELAVDSPATLADWLAAHGAELVLMGRMAGPVAARLGWAHLAGLDRLALAGRRLRAERCLGRGDREKVEADLPAAVRIEAARRPRYLARARLAAARALPIGEHALPERAPLPAAAAPGALAPARARTRLSAAAAAAPARPSARGSERLQALLRLGAGAPRTGTGTASGTASPTFATARPADDPPATPEAMAESFVRYLAHHKLIPDPS